MKIVAMLDTDKNTPQITCSFDPAIDDTDEKELKKIVEERMMTTLSRLKTRYAAIQNRKRPSGKKGHVLHPDVYEAVRDVLERANYPLSVRQILGALALTRQNQPSYNTVRRYLANMIYEQEAEVERQGSQYVYRRKE